MFLAHTYCGRFGVNSIEKITRRCLFLSNAKELNLSKTSNRLSVYFLKRALQCNSYLGNRLYSVENYNKKYNWYKDDDFEELKKKREAQWKRTKITLTLIGSLFGMSSLYLIHAVGSPKRDEAGNVIEDEFSTYPVPIQFFKRILRELEYFNKMMRQPVTDKLLPDPLVYPYYQPEYTLILEMSDILIHADWTYQTGWRFKKRPGVDKFLELVTAPMFELVIFTSEHGASTMPLLNALDPNGYVIHKLTRDSTEFSDGNYIKNLEYINRDLNKVIVVDWNKDAVKLHHENALILPRWGGEDDTMLIELAVFLRAIASTGVEDVREILSYYNQYENPVEAFRENQRQLLEQMEESEELEKQRGTNYASKWAKTFSKL